LDIGVSDIYNHVAAVTSILSRRDLLSSIGARYDMDHLKGYQITADVAAIAEIAASPLVGSLIPAFFQYLHYHVQSSWVLEMS
jgi:hypothetical protein